MSQHHVRKPEPWYQRYEDILRSWEGTPWVAGQCVRGKCTDCVRFVIAVLDEMYVIKAPLIPRKNQQFSYHNREAAFELAHMIATRYPSEVIKDSKDIMPADVVVVRNSEEGGPGHVLLAGVMPFSLWHCAQDVGVCRTSLTQFKIVEKIWRPLEKSRWLL